MTSPAERPVRYHSCRRVLTLLAVLVGVVTVTVGTRAAEAQNGGRADDDGPTSTAAPADVALAERFAPILFVREQDEPCDTDGEPFEPAPVEIVLDNPEVFLRQVGNDDPVAIIGPSAADIFDLREGWYLDFPGDALNPGCIFEQDFARFFDGRSVMYARVATQADRPGLLALQYWFFWYHNPAKNDHEGDWEFIQVLFEADTAAEALRSDPIAVGYAQHEGGERADWTDPKLDRQGDRPIAYPAVGSHATYFGQALYFGRSGAEGFGCDNTDGPSRRLDPEVVMLPDAVTDPDDPLAWLAFQGRWGQRERAFFNGPTGPFAKARWDAPITWHERLRDTSVVVPGGDRFGDGVVRTFCTGVEIGSTWLGRVVRSPAIGLAALATLLGLIVAVVRRTTWTPASTAPVRSPRAFGQVLTAAKQMWVSHPGTMARAGLVYIPVAFVTGLIEVAVESVPFVDSLLGLAGTRSEVGVFVAVFVGGVGNILAFVYVSGLVARLIALHEQGSRPGPGEASLSRAEVRWLLVSVLRATVVVGSLVLTVVGIPWAIRQLVRYQVAPQAVVLEGRDAAQALARSSALVRGRWWWTAGAVAAIQAAIVVTGIAVALVVFLAFPGIPLWAFNVISATIYVATIPLGAAAMTYVYGRLVAEGRTTSASDPTTGDADADAEATGLSGR